MLFAISVGAQTNNRIQTFDSVITIDRDRTIHVKERLDLFNDGSFDGGVHRQLRIKPASAERMKTGSFESFSATIDGPPGTVKPGQVEDKLDAVIALNTGTLERGTHVVEFAYTARHQFEVYDYFEDFNQSVTGEWSVPILKATAEVHFPEGPPGGSGISADTGLSAGADQKFDCLQRDIPSGIRFETTHALLPGHRLFLSSRFPKGYFRSIAAEDGYRAVLQDHPYLEAKLAAAAGAILAFAAGIVAWRRAPPALRSSGGDT